MYSLFQLPVSYFFTVFALFLSASSFVYSSSWSKTILAQTEWNLDIYGAPIIDDYGDPTPNLPVGYQPSLRLLNSGMKVLRVEMSMVSEPPVLDGLGAPILDDYFKLNIGSLATGGWTLSDDLTELMADLEQPAFVSRLDDVLSVSSWKDGLLMIDTVADPSNTRLTLPIPGAKRVVAIDENEGVHALVINSEYELWHYYYASATLSSAMISAGPVCEVEAVAGEGDECHIAYATFSEDLNFNGELDEGEDVNSNGTLEETAQQLIYQSLDSTTAATPEVILGETLLNLCHFDLLFSDIYGLKMAYADVVTNAVHVAKRGVSTWTTNQVSSVAGVYESVALSERGDGDCAISYVSADGRKLFVSEENAGVWTESLVASSATGNYFTETDVAFNGASALMVAATEKDKSYLAAYTKTALPSLLATLVKPISIRGVFIVTWPTAASDATSQLLQMSTDLSEPNSWVTIEQRNFNTTASRESAETTVEHGGSSAFYRVVEVSD